MDGFIDEFVFLVTYCANETLMQLPPFMRRELTQTSPFWIAADDLARRGDNMYTSRERDYHPAGTILPGNGPYDSTETWPGWGKWLTWRSEHWVRTKTEPVNLPAVAIRRSLLDRVSRQQWFRATTAVTFSLFDYAIGIIDSFAGTTIGAEITMTVMNVQDWLENDNEDYYAGPVGARYWALFFVRCQFQPKPGQLPQNAGINLNCRVGIGLESAIGWVTPILLGVFIVGSLVLPPILIPFQLIPLALLYVIVVPAVAWHYSPRCWLMSPALGLPGAGSLGISVPYWPFPIAFPALPFCTMDEIYNLVAKYTAVCWCQIWWGTWLEFLCPPYMVSGNPCPPCPQRITVFSCKDLGLYSGIDNIIFIVVHWIPDVGIALKAFSETVFFTGHFGVFMTSVGDYLASEVDRFSNLSTLQADQFTYCFGVTIFTISGWIIVGVLVFTFVALVFEVATEGIGAFWGVVVASPFAYFIPGGGSDPYADFSNGEGVGVANSTQPYIAVRIDDDGRLFPRHVNRPAAAATRSAIGHSIDEFVQWAAQHVSRVMRD
jgi:hypothetical protein